MGLDESGGGFQHDNEGKRFLIGVTYIYPDPETGSFIFESFSGIIHMMFSDGFLVLINEVGTEYNINVDSILSYFAQEDFPPTPKVHKVVPLNG